jgi:hypothetical protein
MHQRPTVLVYQGTPYSTYTTFHQSNMHVMAVHLAANSEFADILALVLLLHEHTHGGPSVRGGGQHGKTGPGRTEKDETNCGEILARQISSHEFCAEASSMIDNYNAMIPPTLKACNRIKAMCTLIQGEIDAANAEPFAPDFLCNRWTPHCP